MVFIWMDSTYVVNHKNEPFVVVFARDSETDKVETFKFKGFKPYFYVGDEEGELLSCYGDPITKVEINSPREVNEKKRSFPPQTKFYESDVAYDMRFMIDRGIYYGFNEKGEPVDTDILYAPRICYFDIEVMIPEGGNIDAKTAEYSINVISFKDSFTGETRVLTAGMDKVAEDQISYKTEKELLEGFASLVHEYDFDVLTGWYSEIFDIPYILNRAVKVHANINKFSRLRTLKPNDYRFPGRQRIDMMDYFKKWSTPMGKMPYDLKSVAKMADYTYEDYGANIVELVENKDWLTIVTYARHDVESLYRIDDKFKLSNFYESFRKLVGCKITDVLNPTRYVEWFIMHMGVKPMPTRTVYDKVKYAGAHVVLPPIGLHENIAAVDIAAMYPFIMCAYNISPDIDKTIPKAIKLAMDKREVLRARRLAGDNDPVLATSEQALKAMTNAFYGYLGSPYSRMYSPKLAGKITSTGVEMGFAIDRLLISRGYKIYYGDSVSGDTNVDIVGKGTIPIKELFTNVDYVEGDKEYCDLNNIKTPTINEYGYTVNNNVPYIMRHKTSKSMYRVWFNDTHIDVTEDHSLIGFRTRAHDLNIQDRMFEIKPTEQLDKCSLITQKVFNDVEYDDDIPIEVYNFLGFFLGDGSFEKNSNGKVSKNVNLATGIDYDEVVSKYVVPLQNINWITNYKTHGDKGDIRVYGKICEYLQEHFLIGESKKNFDLSFAMNLPFDKKAAIIRGLFDSDGTVIGDNTIRLTNISHEFCLQVRDLLKRVGVKSYVFTENNPNSYNGVCSNTFSSHVNISSKFTFKNAVGFLIDRKHNKISGVVDNGNRHINDIISIYPTRIEKITYDDYVYDIEVEETHNFFANNILVHNTDSRFYGPLDSIEEGLKDEKAINEFLQEWAVKLDMNPIYAPSIKLEKIYDKILFKRKIGSNEAAKKNYAGHLVWKDGEPVDKLDYKGVGAKRSDNSKITKEVMLDFFNTVLLEGDVKRASRVVAARYLQVKSGQVSIHDIAVPRASRSEKDNAWKRGRINGEKLFSIRFEHGATPKLINCRFPEQEVCITDDVTDEQFRHLVGIDWDLMADKTIKKKMESFILSVGLTWEQMAGGQRSLADYMLNP